MKTVLITQDKTDSTKKGARKKNRTRNKLASAPEHSIIGRKICSFFYRNRLYRTP